MPDSIKSSHSRGSFIEAVGDLVTKLHIKGTQLHVRQEKEALPEVNKDQILRVQIMMRAPVDILQHLLESGADPNYTVKGASTYALAKAFGDKLTIELLESYGAKMSLTKKPHSKN